MSTENSLTAWLARLLHTLASRPLKVGLRKRFGNQPNDRDEAEEFSRLLILPALESGKQIILDFEGTGLVTQSFIHALISEAVKGDARNADRIVTINASRAQQAVYDLALRHMVDPMRNKIRSGPTLQAQ